MQAETLLADASKAAREKFENFMVIKVWQMSWIRMIVIIQEQKLQRRDFVRKNGRLERV